MTNEAYWKMLLANLQCVVCRRFESTGQRPQLHHVASGSGKRSAFALVPLCHEHHQGSLGFHGIGSKAFIRMFRPPGDSEYGLIVWACEDLSHHLKVRL